MDRVLNKDSITGSSLNSALIAFSDVFHPASCMQSPYLSCQQELRNRLFYTGRPQTLDAVPARGESDEEW